MGYLIHLNDQDFIKTVPTNDLSNIKNGLLEEEQLDEDMIMKLSMILVQLSHSNRQILCMQAVTIALIYVLLQNQSIVASSETFIIGMFMTRLCFIALCYLETLIDKLAIQQYENKISFVTRHAQTVKYFEKLFSEIEEFKNDKKQLIKSSAKKEDKVLMEINLSDLVDPKS